MGEKEDYHLLLRAVQMHRAAMKSRQRTTNRPLWKEIFPQADEGIIASGVSFHLWRLYQHAWLICLLFPILPLIHQPPPLLLLLLQGAALVCFAAVYTSLMWPHPASLDAQSRFSFPARILIVTLLTAFVLTCALLWGEAWLWLLVGTSAIAGLLLPTWPASSAVSAVMALTLLTLVTGIALSGGWERTDWLHLLPLVMLVRGLGLDLIGFTRLSATLHALEQAKAEHARLRVQQERLRLSRDLHDVLGHTLSLITLKSELARRLVKEHPERAQEEISQIEQIARASLREVREAVSGERHPSLIAELDAAGQLLEAAGIRYQITREAEPVEPAVDAALAWVVREGVTNVIRHSCASFCHISLFVEAEAAICVEIANDGYQHKQGEQGQQGSGLRGLEERIVALGGSILRGPEKDEAHKLSYHLKVMVPLHPQPETRREQIV